MKLNCIFYKKVDLGTVPVCKTSMFMSAAIQKVLYSGRDRQVGGARYKIQECFRSVKLLRRDPTSVSSFLPLCIFLRQLGRGIQF